MGIKERYYWIDLLRFIASFGVVCVHVTSKSYSSFQTSGAGQWWVSNIMNATFRASVVIFIMISGLLLRPDDCRVLLFYRKRASRLFPAIVFWSFLYVLFDLLVMKMGLREIGFMLLTKGHVYYHLWFVNMLFFLLLFVPFIAKIFFHRETDHSEVMILLVVSSSFVLLDWTIRFLNSAYDLQINHWNLDFIFFVPYLLLGAVLGKYSGQLERKRKQLFLALLLILLVCYLANYYSCRYLGLVRDYMPLSKDSPFVYVLAVVVFLLVKANSNFIKPGRHLIYLGDAAFGVYLVHPVFIWFLARIFRDTSVDALAGAFLPVSVVMVYLMSFLTVTFIRRFSLGRKIC